MARTKIILISLIINLSVLSSLYADTTKEITLAADEWCPITCSSDQFKPGYMSKIVEVIFKKKGYSVKHKFINWARALEETRAGSLDGVVGGLISDAPDFIAPTKSLGVEQDCFYGNSNQAFHWAGKKSIANKTIGTANGYAYASEEINKLIASDKEEVNFKSIAGDNPLQQNFKKLLDHRIDLVFENNVVADWFIKTYPWAKSIKKLDCIKNEKKELYILFSPANKNSKNYANLISEGITEMRKSGELNKILKNYFVKDWQ